MWAMHATGLARVLMFVAATIAVLGLLYIRKYEPEEWKRIKSNWNARRARGSGRPMTYTTLEGERRTVGEDEPFPRGFVPAPDIPRGLRTASSVARLVITIVGLLIMLTIGAAAIFFFTHLPGFS
jgi:hypothetical protein